MKRKKTVTTTQRTLAYLRGRGLTCEVVEKWIPRINVRKDLFGFIDIVVIGWGPGVVGVQTTSGAHHADHKDKIANNKNFPIWLSGGNKVLLISWSKVKKKRGQKATLWKERLEWLNEEALPSTAPLA